MDFSNIACWIWPLVAGIICAILGYLLGRLFRGSQVVDDTHDYKAALDACQRKTAILEADLNACRLKLKAAPVAASTSASISSFAAGAAVTAAAVPISKPQGISGVPFNTVAAKAAFGKKRMKENDLTVVAGIGPKIRELFHNHDIKTWAALANTSVDRCQEILNSGGKRFEIHNPGTWPMQAEMAALGKWSELKKWQDEHDYGKA